MGFAVPSFFRRSADLFSDEERKAMQQATQLKRREWRERASPKRGRHAETGDVRENTHKTRINLKGSRRLAPLNYCKYWLRGVDLNHRPLGYEPNELPD